MQLLNPINNRDRELFDLAFELAYFIHINKEIAFFIAEDALDSLSSTLGYQTKNRKSADGLRGFLKWGERTRPVRKTLLLHERQMLQWLVFRESSQWELRTERGEGPYLPTEEDLIVRYIEHLVFTTIRRNSFYVTLAIGALLHQFDRRETRLFYDVLTQSDSARMKDTNYIGKQRLEILDRIGQRFEGLVSIAKKNGEEKQFQMRPTTQSVIELVTETLRRFTPSQTFCVLNANFDVLDIPAFYFANDDSDEDLIEKSRIHTVMDPECFGRFCSGLARYVQTLPRGDLDRSCRFDSPNDRIAVPQFSTFQDGPRPSKRFHTPQLSGEDYIRLQRMLEARRHRKKTLVAQRVLIYVDGILSTSFEPQKQSGAQWVIDTATTFVAVCGRDSEGEVTLATLFLDNEPNHESCDEVIIHPGGQRVRISISPLASPGHDGSRLRLEVIYTQKTSALIKRSRGYIFRPFGAAAGAGGTEGVSHALGWLPKLALVTILLITVSILGWRHFTRHAPVPSPLSTADWDKPSEPQSNPSQSDVKASRSLPNANRPSRSLNIAKIAEAHWNMKPESALSAKTVEDTRSESLVLDLAVHQTTVTFNLPVYDAADHSFSHYRLTLFAQKRPIWQKTLAVPKNNVRGYGHLLDVIMLNEQLPNVPKYDLFFFGRTETGWQKIGRVGFVTTP